MATRKSTSSKKKAPRLPKAKSRSAVQTNGHHAEIDDVPVSVTLRVGGATITLDEALNFDEESVIELDQYVADPADVLINGKVVAKGQVVAVNEKFGVRITEIVR